MDSKKQLDRRPDEKNTEHGSGQYDPSKPESGRIGESVDKNVRRPEGSPIDKELPRPGMAGKREDTFEEDRSDRQSGKPLQLEEEREPSSAGRKPGFGERKSEGQKPHEAGSTKH